MAAITDAKLNGAELMRELAKTGTADAKLALPRKVLAFVWRTENRVATANELIDAMEKAGTREPYLDYPQTPDLTLKKATALAVRGVWNGPVEEKVPPVEDLILGGAPALEEEPAKTVAERAVESPNPFDVKGTHTLEDELALKKVAKPSKPKKAAEPVAA